MMAWASSPEMSSVVTLSPTACGTELVANSSMIGDSAMREEVWGSYFGDAIECLTAAARGDRLPEMDDPTAWLDMQAERAAANVMTPEGCAVTLLDLGIDPDFEELAYEEWRRNRHARRGWRRMVPQRSARSSATQ